MRRGWLLASALLALLAPRAQAQTPVQPSTTTAVQIVGVSVSLDRGPWVLGEVLILSGGVPATDYTWRDRVRAVRGALYTKADVLADVDSLKALGRFSRVEPALYEIPNSPIPGTFTGIAVSTNVVRLIYNVYEIAAPSVAASTAPARPLPPAALSGVSLTPTAWRGAGKYNTPGLGLDINATYFIGRLYGKNNFDNSPDKTNYIDRIGVWLLTTDGKMQIQSEGTIRPAAAVGGEATFLFRDSPPPKVNDPNPTVTVNSSQESTRTLTDAYFVMSKKLGPVRTSLGVKQGDGGDFVGQISEFLTPDGLRVFAGHPQQETHSQTVPFASFMLLPKPQYPLAVEIMKFNGAPLNPILINFKIGYFIHTNFDIAILKFQGGYDILGVLQFRYNHFPRR
jgi:hypothetical protein